MVTVDLEPKRTKMNLKKISNKDKECLCHVQWCITMMNTGFTQTYTSNVTIRSINNSSVKNKQKEHWNIEPHPQWQFNHLKKRDLMKTDMHRTYESIEIRKRQNIPLTLWPCCQKCWEGETWCWLSRMNPPWQERQLHVCMQAPERVNFTFGT